MSSTLGKGIGWKAKFADSNIPELHEFIQLHPLGILITGLPGNDSGWPQLQSTHIPFILDTPEAQESDSDTFGVLRSHMARESPHFKAMLQAIQAQNEDNGTEGQTLSHEVMVLFNEPVESYVSPSFYAETKPNSGAVVPTWFFRAVQAYGTLKLYHDKTSPETVTFLKTQTTDLTRHGEEHLMGFSKEKSWKISDAPASFINKQSERIVGVEITITRLEGKSKFGQEIKAGDQLGCLRGFRALESDAGLKMAHMIEHSMEKNATRKKALDGCPSLVQGPKVKGPHGWYFTASEPRKTSAPKYTNMAIGFLAGFLTALILALCFSGVVGGSIKKTEL